MAVTRSTPAATTAVITTQHNEGIQYYEPSTQTTHGTHAATTINNDSIHDDTDTAACNEEPTTMMSHTKMKSPTISLATMTGNGERSVP